MGDHVKKTDHARTTRTVCIIHCVAVRSMTLQMYTLAILVPGSSGRLESGGHPCSSSTYTRPSHCERGIWWLPAYPATVDGLFCVLSFVYKTPMYTYNFYCIMYYTRSPRNTRVVRLLDMIRNGLYLPVLTNLLRP